MYDIYQKTIDRKISFSGVALHSGKNSIITINPGNEDQGIIFKRTDLKENNLVIANYNNVSSAKLCTTLENGHGVKVSTVEHLLAAFYIIGIDNALVEVNCEEIPIMDGSAKDFLDILKDTKLITLSKKRRYLKIIDKIEHLDGERKISIEPNKNSLEVGFQLNYKNKIIGKQKNVIDFKTDDLSEVSNSRTFCLYEDIEKIKQAGLAKGGSLDNAIVVEQEKVLNKDGLRNEKEFVNHKILDLAGDFLLSGFRVLGKVNCYQGGHELTNIFLRKIFKNESLYQIIELEDVIPTKKNNSSSTIKLAVNA